MNDVTNTVHGGADVQDSVPAAGDSATLTQLIAMFRQREKIGLAKYGTTVDRTDLSLRDWLQHALEESMDKSLYLLRAIETAPKAYTGEPLTYSSTQATNCAGCGKHKHTPLRVDWMGGYVCLTCIDNELEGRDPDAEPAAWMLALEAAVSAIYFNDSSDYLTALWQVVQHLRPDMVDLLQSDENTAYNQVKAMVGDAPEVPRG